MKVKQFATTAIGDDAGNAGKKKFTKILNPVCGNWPMDLQNIVVENALADVAQLECGLAQTGDANCKNL